MPNDLAGRAKSIACLLALTLGLALIVTNVQGDDAKPAKTPSAADNRADEPKAESFSLKTAAEFLDKAATDWTKSRQCFTCHTNYAYLMARPAVSTKAARSNASYRETRQALEDMVEKRWKDKGPRWDAEVVMTAAVLAYDDSAMAKPLHAATRTALDRIWTVQHVDGGFNWLKCDWPPMESDDHFGALMAAIAVGTAPKDYDRSAPQVKKGMSKLRDYFAKTPDPTLHHRAMRLWAASYPDWKDLVTDSERQTETQKLLALQRPDGGWSLPSLGDWKREDGSPQDPSVSDGYGTGFVVYVLRQTGVPQNHPQIQKAVAWLKSNQRASGRWYTRSLHNDSKHFITHAGTAFALMALAQCGETLADSIH